MKKLITSLILVSFLILSLPSYTDSYIKPPEVPKMSIDELISLNAIKYHVSSKTLHSVIKCESGYNELAIGDSGQSYGLVQIHLPSNKTITKTQAFNPEFAIEFLAKGLSTGRGNAWTCFRSIRSIM